MNQSSTERLQRSFAELPLGPKTMMLGAGALIAYGISRRSKVGTAIASAGGVLAYGALRQMSQEPREVKATFLVNAPAEQCYRTWRDYENLPKFMAHLKSVRTLGNNQTEWVALGPMQRENLPLLQRWMNDFEVTRTLAFGVRPKPAGSCSATPSTSSACTT